MSNKMLYFIIICFLSLLLIITNWGVHIKREKMPRFDQWSRPLVDIVAETKIYTVFRWITEFGSFYVVFPLTILVIILLWVLFKSYIPALIFGSGVLSAYLFNQLLKQLIARERPSISVILNAEGYSFPSGHSMVTIVCYGLIAYFIGIKMTSFKRKVMVQLMLGSLVLLIGLSRYILNVHYITDIVSGFTFGSVILFLCIYIHKKINYFHFDKENIK